MSAFTTRTAVRCSLDQAGNRLARYFAAHGNADGDVVRVKLRVRLPSLGSAASPAWIERHAIATAVPVAGMPHALLPAYDMTWAVEGGGPYPVFVGTLAIEPDEDLSTFFLSLTGDYEAPFGIAGAAFDASIGRRVAKMAVADLLLGIANDIEERCLADEREARRRIGVPKSARYT